jgi:hypothetical protein
MNTAPVFCEETTILINLELSSFGDRIYDLPCRLKSSNNGLALGNTS